ncbi:hypothetical protein B0J15DRAFT_60952 [Fusarium solani]|uniref:Uncharacterized protein n=1 Tax=Fusarium solani TaxID=169388 RepID=A0A9P9H182_FUSSL|nr:uncharacterized protein B0J15DRAFT_60952 [Fusarium solani]KAH7248364.1 hypothetical protein B0J15DRAFT_60952 [Fusarium solani]
MDCLSFEYLKKLGGVQVTYYQNSHSAWLLHQADGHFIAEQLSASPHNCRKVGCLKISSSVFPCCEAAPTDVDGDRAFSQTCLKERITNLPECPAPSGCRPSGRSPFWPRPAPSSSPFDASMPPSPHPTPSIELSTRRAGELSSESDVVGVSPVRGKRGKKRTSSNTSGREAPSKRKTPPPNKVASLLWKQISGTSNKNHRERNFLPGDSDIAKKLNDFQQLVNARPDQTDRLVGELQEWLRQTQQDSSLHLAALQHLLTCIDLYNWANQNDDTLERSKDKTRWHEVQVARYRNRLANEVCKIKGGNSDHLGLVVLPLMTGKQPSRFYSGFADQTKPSDLSLQIYNA